MEILEILFTPWMTSMKDSNIIATSIVEATKYAWSASMIIRETINEITKRAHGIVTRRAINPGRAQETAEWAAVNMYANVAIGVAIVVASDIFMLNSWVNSL